METTDEQGQRQRRASDVNVDSADAKVTSVLENLPHDMGKLAKQLHEDMEQLTKQTQETYCTVILLSVDGDER